MARYKRYDYSQGKLKFPAAIYRESRFLRKKHYRIRSLTSRQTARNTLTPEFIPISFDKQILPGTLEHTLNYIIDNEIDISAFDLRYQNDETGDPAYACQVAYFTGATRHKTETFTQKMRRKTDSLRSLIYNRRLATAERVFSHLRAVLGFNQFTLRGKRRSMSNGYCTARFIIC